MYIFVIDAVASGANEKFHTGAQASFVVLIDYREQWGFEILARAYLEEGGWRDMKTVKAGRIEETDMAKGNEEEQEHYRAARENGYSISFYGVQKAH